jgi:hypothetical protein
VRRAPVSSGAIVALATVVACGGAACGSAAPTGSGGRGGATATTTSSAIGGGGSGGATTTQSTSTTSSAIASSGGGSTPLPDQVTVTGVVTDGTSPVEGAIVMQGGKAPLLTTGPDGAFSIEVLNDGGIPTVVAAKIGYRSAGFELFEVPQGPIELVLKVAAPPDNTGYKYQPPGQGVASLDTSTAVCGHCHTTYTKDFRASAHARAAKDPLVQDLYAGVASSLDQASCAARGGVWRTGVSPGTGASTSKCYIGAGVLPGLNPSCGGPSGLACDDPALPAASKPTSFGRCADCHAPGIDGVAGGRDLLEAASTSYDAGVHCDVCHHIKDVDLTRPAGVAGALILQRPNEKVGTAPNAPKLQILYGPEPDVPNPFMGGSYQPKFTSSELCGGCHQQKQEALVPGATLDPVRWPDGLPTHSTYEEWSASQFAGTKFTCQYCHMPPDDHGLSSSVDVTQPDLASQEFGFLRKPEQLRKHTFRDPLEGNPRLIDGAVTVQIATQVTGTELSATVTLQSFTAGHAVPTGEPMRSFLLVVRAFGCGSELSQKGGMTLDDWGGARARGVVGPVVVNGHQITWPSVNITVGSVVRASRPTGTFVDYTGVGFFADPTLTPLEKGLEIQAPVGEATVVSVAGSTLTLDKPLAVTTGDVLYVGDPFVWPPVEGSPSAALAGRAGLSFAKTMLGANGARRVPHFLAVDVESDNRIPPGGAATTDHTFTVPPGCGSVDVGAAVIYRRIPLDLAIERGYDARDVVVSGAQTTVAVP